jgi:hypothetical protein
MISLPRQLGLRAGLVLTLVSVVSVGLPAASAKPASSVPTPSVSGPVSGGIKNGPQLESFADVAAQGYVEEEFFFSGTAKTSPTTGILPSVGVPGAGGAYTTRMIVRRPKQARDFNGTVFVEWMNVTTQRDMDIGWQQSYDMMMHRGYAYVGVTVQKQGADGSPIALKGWDPVRYGSVQHPGDDYAYDIFTQAAKAVRVGAGKVLGPLRASYLIGLAESQSASQIVGYINSYYDKRWGLFDGFNPQVFSVPKLRSDLVPVLWVNSESEAGSAPPDKSRGLFRIWETTGGNHVDARQGSYQKADLARPTADPSSSYDPDNPPTSGYGEDSTGVRCPVEGSVFPGRYVWNAALVAIDRWVRGGPAPASHPFARDADGAVIRDPDTGNVRGGVRLPPITVPIAKYIGDEVGCPLMGYHQMYDAEKLAELYPTHNAYVEKMTRAARQAVADKIMLADDVPELLRHARASSIPVRPSAVMPS